MVAQRIGVAHRYATQVSAMCKMLRKAGTKVKKVARGKRARSLVLQGKKARTKSGLTKSDLKRNKKGRIVPKKKSEACKKNSHEHTVRWSACVQRARDAPHCRVVPRRWPERDGQKVAQEDQGAVRRDVSILLIPLARQSSGAVVLEHFVSRQTI